MRRQSDDYMAIPDRKRLARRGKTQRATRGCRPVLSLLNASEILQFAAPALAALRSTRPSPGLQRAGLFLAMRSSWHTQALNTLSDA